MNYLFTRRQTALYDFSMRFNKQPLEDDMMLMMMLSGAMGGNKAGIGNKRLLVFIKSETPCQSL